MTNQTRKLKQSEWGSKSIIKK